MKSIVFILLLCVTFFIGKSQDTIRYAVNGSTDTRLLKMRDSISISIVSREKNLQYRVASVALSFKRYDMKMLKTIKDTVINFPARFKKNPAVVFKPGDFPMFKQAEALTITAGEVIKKNKKGKTETAVNVFGREKELQIVK